MKSVIQRVTSASVEVDGKIVGKIDRGLLVLIGVAQDDSEKDSKYMINKIINLRIFPDEKSIMNKSVLDIGGEILLVSQFTLYGNCKKGNRPSFCEAMKPDLAEKFFEKLIQDFKSSYPKVECGVFGAKMNVSLLNDGPVTILIDSPKK